MAARDVAHSDFMFPNTSRMWLKLLQRLVLETIFTGSSAKCSQQMLIIHLGLPGLSGFLPHHLIQLTTKW